MDSVGAIIDALGGVTTVAAVIECPLGTVSSWKTRGSIPAEYWDRVVVMGARRSVPGVTYETLAKIAAAKRKAAA